MGSKEQTAAARQFYRLAADEISRISRYADCLIQVDNPFTDNESVFSEIIARRKERIPDLDRLDQPLNEGAARHCILLNATFNYSLDIELLLNTLHPRIGRSTRILALTYNPYYRTIFKIASKLGLIRSKQIQTFLTRDSLKNLCRLTGFDIIKIRPVGIFPFHLAGIGSLINRLACAIPFIRWLAPATLIVLRPIQPSSTAPSLSIVVPARNEEGNIPNLLPRLSGLEASEVEVIIVEGNSTDNTWGSIQKLAHEYQGPIRLKVLKQTGKGKSNAVREGFDVATCDLLTILDADLTMPPEYVGRFYEAYRRGLADFINGSRLVYPTEDAAMRFLNKLGNVFFAKSLNFVLEQSLSDSLCGTKLMRRADYLQLKEWRKDFGDFDPFGDFELLFFAAYAGLGIVDVPVYYRARRYGRTNIHRFRHGLILLGMAVKGFVKIRC